MSLQDAYEKYLNQLSREELERDLGDIILILDQREYTSDDALERISEVISKQIRKE